MRALLALIKRNTKLFFKDKGMLFTSLITPAILLVLYATFLAKVYKDSFNMNIPTGPLVIPEKLMNGLVGGQLISSLLAVSCVTVAFCSNFLMVQDKANGSIRDLKISAVKSSTLSMGYYVSSFLSTLIVCLAATVLCLLYMAATGWYMSVADVFLLLGDIILLVLFGTALSSVINYFLSSQGQISAVGTIVSSGYGFICGAYMPISSFGEGLQKIISFLPGTYGTALLRNHAMRGAFEAMKDEGFSESVIEDMRNAIDCNIYFFDNRVEIGYMYAVVCGSVAILIGAYILINSLGSNKKYK